MSSAELLRRARSGALEACHCGHLAVWHHARGLIASVGEADRLVVPRSSAKLVLALPFLASGAADGCAASLREIVLAAASHAALPEQIEVLAGFARRLGIDVGMLACGPDFPLGRTARKRPGDVPTALDNNNSGKHLGVIATCLHHGEALDGYGAASHPAQQRLVDATMLLCGVARPASLLLDRCGLTTFPLPLSALARGMARLARPAGLPEPMAAAAARLLDAIALEPDFLAAPGRIVSELARQTAGRVIIKGGAEGIYAALDRQHGIGIALKVDDGSGEAATAAIIEALVTLGCLSPVEAEPLRRKADFWAHPFRPDLSSSVAFPFLDTLDPGVLTRN